MALTDKLTAIGDAIRSKTGGSDLLTLDEMPQEIQSIQTGGGGGGGGTDTALADSIIDGTVATYSSDAVTSIQQYRFSYSSLTSASFPNVTYVALSAFYNCSSLQSVNLPKATCVGSTFYSASSSAFYYCSSLVDISIPLVNNLGTQCFYGCSSLQRIDLPSVEGIGLNVFRSCSKLDTVILRNDAVVTLSNISSFTSTPIAKGTGYIYVPQALIEDYKVATNWVTYASQFRAIEDYPEICGGDA